MKYLLLALILTGCSTTPQFYTVDRQPDWNTMYNQDGEIVAVNVRGTDDWEYQREIDQDLAIVDGDKVFFNGKEVR